MEKIRVLNLNGAPYEMGFSHGAAYRADILSLAEDRIQLCRDPLWTGHSPTRPAILALAENCLPYHWDYSPESMEELEGVAAATGLSLAELIITNGFTDFVDYVMATAEHPADTPARGMQLAECTTFMVGGDSTTDGSLLIGQTWDMHASALSHIILLRARPQNAPAFLAFTLTGCVGMLGMNAAGVVVCINNLLATGGRAGVTWPFVARKILAQTNLEDALACITDAQLAGAHHYMIADATGRGYNVEAMPDTLHIEPLTTFLTRANRCHAESTRAVECVLSESWITDSDIRTDRAATFLGGQAITPETLMALTRDRSDEDSSICSYPNEPYHTQTCCAAIMRPATRDFWGVWGPPDQNSYEHFLAH